MDWAEKSEQKKRLRKMAGRMLWADFKGAVCSWNVIFMVCMYFGFFLLPYSMTENINTGTMVMFLFWVLAALNSLPETVFNYLPLSTEDIVYYLKYRTNLLTAWVTLISVGTGAVMYAAGAEVFVERGLMVLCFVLMAVEGELVGVLYSYSKSPNTIGTESGLPKPRKIRFIIYGIYCFVMVLVNMFMWLLMDYDENRTTKLVFILCAYLVMYIFRADLARWVQFKEFTKGAGRNIFAVQQQQNQQNSN